MDLFGMPISLLCCKEIVTEFWDWQTKMVPYCILNFYFLLMSKDESTTLWVKKHLHFYVELIFALFLYFCILLFLILVL